MRKEIRYVENKDSGEAWIGYCQFLKSGRSVYFNNKVFKRANVTAGNHFDIETSEEYWISGIKKNREDRHWGEPGTISVERTAFNEYLKFVGLNSLPKSRFILVDLINSPNKELSSQITNRKFG